MLISTSYPWWRMALKVGFELSIWDSSAQGRSKTVLLCTGMYRENAQSLTQLRRRQSRVCIIALQLLNPVILSKLFDPIIFMYEIGMRSISHWTIAVINTTKYIEHIVSCLAYCRYSTYGSYLSLSVLVLNILLCSLHHLSRSRVLICQI